MCLVSIIIPVYNTGKILTYTLDSVISQSYNDVEIILVDDGSTDNSGGVCIEYASKDSRIKYYRKENEGICSSRNFGLNRCHGEYVFFSDHDDVMDKYLIEKSLNAIKETNADMVKFGVKLFDEENERVSIRSFRSPKRTSLPFSNVPAFLISDCISLFCSAHSLFMLGSYILSLASCLYSLPSHHPDKLVYFYLAIKPFLLSIIR